MPHFPDHRSLLGIECCSFLLRAWKHKAIKARCNHASSSTFSSPPHFLFCREIFISILAGAMCFKLLLIPPRTSGVGKQPIFQERQETAFGFCYSKTPFHLFFFFKKETQAAGPALMNQLSRGCKFIQLTSPQLSRSQPFRMSEPLAEVVRKMK